MNSFITLDSERVVFAGVTPCINDQSPLSQDSFYTPPSQPLERQTIVKSLAGSNHDILNILSIDHLGDK